MPTLARKGSKPVFRWMLDVVVCALAAGALVPQAASPALTTLASVSSAGVPGRGSSSNPALSADGRFVAFSSDAANLVPGDTNEATDVFLHDRVTGITIRVSVSSTGTEGNAAPTSSSTTGRGSSRSAAGTPSPSSAPMGTTPSAGPKAPM